MGVSQLTNTSLAFTFPKVKSTFTNKYQTIYIEVYLELLACNGVLFNRRIEGAEQGWKGGKVEENLPEIEQGVRLMHLGTCV